MEAPLAGAGAGVREREAGGTETRPHAQSAEAVPARPHLLEAALPELEEVAAA